MQFTLIENELGSCEHYMESYIDMIRRDYRHGWEDCSKNRSNLFSSDTYIQGYEDCEYEKSLR